MPCWAALTFAVAWATLGVIGRRRARVGRGYREVAYIWFAFGALWLLLALAAYVRSH
jgi:hypothetical protein